MHVLERGTAGSGVGGRPGHQPSPYRGHDPTVDQIPQHVAGPVPLADPELSEKMGVTYPGPIPSLDVESAAGVGCRSFVTAEIAGRQAHAAHRHFECALACMVQRAGFAKLVRGDVRVVRAAALLDVARRLDPGADQD